MFLYVTPRSYDRGVTLEPGLRLLADTEGTEDRCEDLVGGNVFAQKPLYRFTGFAEKIREDVRRSCCGRVHKIAERALGVRELCCLSMRHHLPGCDCPGNCFDELCQSVGKRVEFGPFRGGDTQHLFADVC